MIDASFASITLKSRECHSVSNRSISIVFFVCFFNSLLKWNIKTFPLIVLCEGNSQLTDGFPSQRASIDGLPSQKASIAESVPISWRLHEATRSDMFISETWRLSMHLCYWCNWNPYFIMPFAWRVTWKASKCTLIFNTMPKEVYEKIINVDKCVHWNLSWQSDVIWRRGSLSTLIQVTAW